MIAQEIIQSLEEPTKDRRPIKKAIEENASIDELINALRISKNVITKQILCEVLGNRHKESAIPALLEMLQDENAGARGESADAIAKIGSADAGSSLINQLFVENDTSVKQTIVLALGATGYSLAIPNLIDYLADPDGTLRGCAAWSLGVLKAKDAQKYLGDALKKETNRYAKKQILEALIILSHE